MKETFEDATKYGNDGGTKFQVDFFNLKDGEKAIVRFLVDSQADLAPFYYHEIELSDGTKKKVNCARSIKEDLSKCPMCSAGMPVNSISYIHMIQYTIQPDGSVKAEPKTWGKKFSTNEKSIVGQILNYLKEYGPLSEYVSTISRTGTDWQNTNYSIKVDVPEKVYGPASNYPLDKSLFDGYSEDGTVIKNWSTDEMNTFMQTGQLPEKNKQNNDYAGYDPATARPAYQSVAPSQVNDGLPFNDATTVQTTTPVYAQQPQPQVGYPNNVPFGVQAADTMERPVRRFN